MGRSLVILVFLLCSSLSAEIVYMKDGRILEGSIVAQNDQTLDIKTKNGLQKIQKSTVRRIAYHTAEEKAKLEAERKARRDAAMKELERMRQLRAQEEEARKRADIARQAELAKQRAAAAKAVRESVEREDMEKPDDIIGFKDFAWRSALVPGWGHFAIGRPIVGSIYAGATAGAIYNIYDKRRKALAARDANHNDVLVNLLVSVAPVDAPLPFRLAYGVDANRRAFTEYKARINRYNYSIASLGIVYGVQMTHIILNGITWESGFIVDNGVRPSFDISYNEHNTDERSFNREPDKQIVASFRMTF